ncbi:prolyl oligopeptidase family serine peptidase [Lachnospiraceae bacterium 62-26]|nr:alpha/beta hydrolase [bacterium 1XD21-13]
MDETENITNEVTPTVPSADNEQDSLPINKGIIAEQLLDGKDGVIHYSYYLPENYSADRLYPMMVVMPGYDMMWFGEESSGTNLNWHGFLSWRELEEDMIVVSAQLTDWGEKSARQAIELTEFFLDNFPVDCDRVYAAGYSAGGETMSQAVSMRPDLYAAYLHGASRWDGAFEPVAENGVAVYIFMAENDEYYGSQKARDAYQGLYEAYQSIGWTQAQIDEVLQVEIPDNEYFNSRGIYNYHGGGNILFEDQSILQWIVEKKK